MAVSNAVVLRVRTLAIMHIVVGALLIIFGIADGVTAVLGDDFTFMAGYGFYGVWIGTWMCIAGGLGIPGSSLQRTRNRNCFAGVFMGFAITSAVLGGQMIMAYSLTIANASYSKYYYGNSYELVGRYRHHRYSYEAKMGLAAVILVLGIVEFGTGIWVSVCLCLMKPCCRDSEQIVILTSGAPGYAMAQGEGGVPVAVPLPASGVTVQTQSSYGYALAGQTTGVPVPFQAVGNQPHPVGASSSGGGFPPQDTEKSPNLGQYVPLEEQI